MIAQFTLKSSYGRTLIYPVNETAQKLTGLTGKKTMIGYDKIVSYTLA